MNNAKTALIITYSIVDACINYLCVASSAVDALRNKVEKMATSGHTLKSMNNSEDFQPETGNPQNEVGGSLQPNVSDLQPNSNDSSLNPQALPQTDSLKVQTNSTTQTSKNAEIAAVSNGTPTGIFLVVIVIFVLILLAVTKSAKPASKKLAEPAESKPERKATVLKDKVLASEMTAKSKIKKKAKKKKSKKRR